VSLIHATCLNQDRYHAFDPKIEKLNKRTEIPLNKNKITLLLIGSLAFVVFGIWFTFEPEIFIPKYGRFRTQNPDIILFVGILSILFFGTTTIYGIRKLFDKKTGLIIDSDGITDNSNASSIGLIEWNDISEIRTMQVMSTKFLLIDIVNPENYIQKAKNGIQARLMRANMNLYETPLSISTNTLKYDFEELEKLIQKEFKRNKNAR
jgi:hypothetical protein